MDRQLLLLGLLRREGMHGYQLNEFIEEKMQFCTDLKKSTAYYFLDKLSQEGYVEMEEIQEGKRPPRQVYHITKKGEAYFFELLRDNLAEYERSYYPMDIGIAFMDQLPPAEISGYLREKRDKVQAELEVLENTTGHKGTLQHVLDRNRRLVQTELAWLDDLLKTLNGGEG
jgi:DNA-binding PadR family transcriptional regulator